MAQQMTYFIVDGITDDAVAYTIKNSVEALDGVSVVNVDIPARKVTVGFNPEMVDSYDIVTTIENLGHDVMQ